MRMFFAEPVPVSLARQLGAFLVTDTMLSLQPVVASARDWYTDVACRTGSRRLPVAPGSGPDSLG